MGLEIEYICMRQLHMYISKEQYIVSASLPVHHLYLQWRRKAIYDGVANARGGAYT